MGPPWVEAEARGQRRHHRLGAGRLGERNPLEGCSAGSRTRSTRTWSRGVRSVRLALHEAIGEARAEADELAESAVPVAQLRKQIAVRVATLRKLGARLVPTKVAGQPGRLRFGAHPVR